MRHLSFLHTGILLVLSILLVFSSPLSAQIPGSSSQDFPTQDPPFGGTIFIDPDIVTPMDPSSFDGVTYAGQGMRTMYDRRVSNWITVNAFLFDATFDDGLTAEIQVNPEFGNPTDAQTEAETYGWAIGQLPTALRADMQTVWIHKGVEPFGGGNNNILIHTGQAANYINDGILEETLIHEAAHTSLDAYHANAAGWLNAQTLDGEFISDYARDFPMREDIAESFLPYLAIRYRSDRITASLDSIIVNTIPNRIAYFDNLNLDMYPITPATHAGMQGTFPEMQPISFGSHIIPILSAQLPGSPFSWQPEATHS